MDLSLVRILTVEEMSLHDLYKRKRRVGLLMQVGTECSASAVLHLSFHLQELPRLFVNARIF